MLIRSVNLETVCGITSTIPENEHYEVAFAGKSNVGKSSLINALLNRNSLARTSSQPGKTQTINFYNINQNLYFVDLPGYGFAKRSKSEIKRLEQMIQGYILQRQQLVNVFVLVDIRHEPQPIDLQFIDWLGQSSIPFSIVFTKADKLSIGQRKTNTEKYKAKLMETWEELPPMFVTSSEKKTGRDELLDYIDQIIKELNQ